MAEPIGAEILIALQPQRVGGRSYEPGDRYDFDDTDQPHHVRHDHMRRLRFIGPLTRQSYADAMSKRPVGSIGRGFTTAGLAAMGIVDAPKIEAEGFTAEPDDFVRCDVIVRPRKSGIATAYSVYSTAGQLLTPGELRGKKKLEDFLATLKPLESTDSAQSGSQEAGDPDGRDLHDQSDDGGEPGAPDDRGHRCDEGEAAGRDHPAEDPDQAE